MNTTQPFQQINQQITIFINNLTNKFNNLPFDGQILQKKYLSRLTGKIYNLLNNIKQSSSTRDVFLNIFQSHATNFINNSIILDLIKCHQDVQFAQTLAKRWNDFKFLVFNFYNFLIHCKDYYQHHKIAQKIRLKQKNTIIKKQFEVYPIPVLAVKLLLRLVLDRFQNKIKKIILNILKQERQLNGPSNMNLKLIFQMIQSCSYRQLARINLVKGTVMFLKEARVQYRNQFKEVDKHEEFISHYIVYQISHQLAHLYSYLDKNKLSLISPSQQLEEIHNKCTLQESIANFYIPTKNLVSFYCTCIYNELILYDFDNMLTKSNFFKEIIKKYSFSSKDYEHEIKMYFQVFYRVQEAVIERVIKILIQAIDQKGAEIRSKLNKPKQFIIEMLNFKKSIRKIFAFTKTNSFKIEIAVEKCFKSLMEGYETSKALSQFTDFTIRQCNRLKLDQEQCELKFKQILLLLQSVSAKDLFLIYHQDQMAKRLLDSLNEAKVQVQKTFLHFVAENLGNFLVNQHFSMIKDIESSVQLTQKMSIMIPFINYKWDLRIINPSVWPDSILKHKFQYIKPPVMFIQHLNQLQQFYKEYRGNLSLKWRLEKGVSLFQGKFINNKYRFQAQNIYMIILLHLNQQHNYTLRYSQLLQLITDKQQNDKISHLNNYMKVLAENKLILRNNKQPHSQFQSQEIVCLNQNYTPTEHKPGQTIIIRMSMQLMKILNQNNVEVNKVLKDRQKLIDALLVKMLKHAHSSGNKSISFSQLYNGIITHNFLKNFNFSQTIIKERLQQLILKEYCQRDTNDRKIYRYIA